MITKLIQRVISIREDEIGATLLATAYGFLILLSYYILRAVRDEISAADRGNLQILWTVVFLVMLIAVPAYSALVSRYSRGFFIPLANRFFAANLLVFYLVLRLLPEAARPWIDRVFYVWASVFALFVVTVYWGFIVDLFKTEQGKRIFGFIAVGSSLGGLAGSAVTASLAEVVPEFSLLLIAVLPLEGAAQCAGILHRRSGRPNSAMRPEEAEPARGTAWSGIQTVIASPYLRRIAGYLALMTFASTVLYFQQAELVGEAFANDRPGRTAFFALIDLWANGLTIFAQAFLAAHIIRGFGVGITLAVTPVVAMLGFLSLGVYPLLGVLVVLQVLYRTGRYAIARPGREVLFTVVGREERYKSKAFIDAAVYRGGDLASGWIYAGMAGIGLSLGAIALVAVPVAALWAGIGLTLGKQQTALAEAEPGEKRTA